MSEDERTSLSPEEQASQQVEETQSGGTVAELDTQEPESTGEESIEARLARMQKDYENLQKKLSEQGQELGEYRKVLPEREAELSRYRQTWEQLQARQAAEADPEVAAMQELERLKREDPYNAAALLDVNNRVWDARLKKLKAETLNQSIQAQRIYGELPQAAQMIGVKNLTEAERILSQVGGGDMTPTERAQVYLARHGRYDDWRDQERKEREAEAKRAAALRSLAVDGGGRSVPGLTGANRNVKVMDYWEWRSGTPAARNQMRKSGDQIVLEGAPEGYDPSVFEKE